MHHVSSIGGGSFCLLNIIKNIDRSFFEPIVALKNEGALADEIRKLGITVVTFPSMTVVPYNCSLWSLRSISTYIKVFLSFRQFRILLDRINADAVYLNNMMLYPYLKPAREKGLKTIIHIREHWPLDEHINQLKWAQKSVYKFADLLIAINQYSADMFPDKLSTIIYDWIDMNSRRNGPSISDVIKEKTDGLKVFLFTGGCEPIKGTYEVIKTFINHVSDSDKRLLILGLDSTMRWDGLKGKIKKVLSILGYKTYKERVITMCSKDSRIICKPAIYNLSRILEQAYCMVSFFTMPHANLAQAESIILGTPAIAADTAESREYSLNGKLSILYPIKNEEEFLNSIKQLDKSYTNHKQRLLQERHKIEDLFDPERNINLLNNTLGKFFNLI